MLRELNNERRNLVSDIKLEAASRALREAADRLDDRIIPLKAITGNMKNATTKKM